MTKTYPQSQLSKLYRIAVALLLILLSLKVAAACDGPRPNAETFGKTFPIMLAR
jgi:hypothetical protein